MCGQQAFLAVENLEWPTDVTSAGLKADTWPM